MSAFIGHSRQSEYCDVQFVLDDPEIDTISEQLTQITGAEMGSENWTALINFYLERNQPELLEDYTTDPDDDTFVAFYPSSDEGEESAKALVALIKSLIQNKELLLQFVEESGDEIDWQ